MDILIYWGAITGTIGTLTAIYSVWLNRKHNLPKIIIHSAKLITPDNSAGGTKIEFYLELSNGGLVPISINKFKLNLDKMISSKHYHLFENKKIEPQLTLAHIIPRGATLGGRVLDKALRGESIFLGPGEHLKKLNSYINIFWNLSQENKNYPFYHNLIDPILKGKYTLVCILSTSKQINIKGKYITIMSDSQE